MEYYEKFAYKNADKVISLLPKAKEYFEKQGMQKDKFKYLPNGIEIEQEKNMHVVQNIEYKIPVEKFIIGYSGTIGIANNLDYLIDAAEMMKENDEIHFVLLGDGGEKKRLQGRVEQLSLINVTFLDAVTKNEVAGFLKQIDVAFISLLPEKIFRFGVSPNKVFDYMYAKKPIIWAIEAGNNLVKEANCGVSVPINDALKLKEKILKLKKLQKDELEKLGQNGYNFVNKNHGYKMLARKLIKIVEE
jgi:glycosyltransferase involved in cell wall biosynthesis